MASQDEANRRQAETERRLAGLEQVNSQLLLLVQQLYATVQALSSYMR